jgi:4-hydroxy-tetrahydrodipicolinate reductase
MGQAIAALAKRDAGLTLGAEVDFGDSVEAGIKSSDVAIDFSSADATEDICRLAVQCKRSLVIGTTGHSAGQKSSIDTAAKSIPIVFASNFSVGVNVLFWLTERAARLLGDDFNAQVVETHHVHKKDAPSGTAKPRAAILQREKKSAEIPVRSIREGEVVGEHTVTFSGPGQRLDLAHYAESRETFASGALTAAKWVINKPPGLYTMQDVLGLA